MTKQLSNEEWKTIPDFPLYMVSNFGRIKSFAVDKVKGRIAPPCKGTNYARTTLRNGNIVRREQIHRLVAQAFIPNPDNKPFVNHINCIRNDNRVGNLEWCTPKENSDHAVANGRLTKAAKNGGESSAELAVNEAYDKYSPLVGFKVNSWTILEYLGRVSINSTHKRPAFMCKCKCGKKQTIEASRLTIGHPSTRATMCNDCALLERLKQTIEANYNELAGTIQGTWYITGDHTSLYKKIPSNKIEWYVECIICGTPNKLNHKKLTQNLIKNCPNCKGKDIV